MNPDMLIQSQQVTLTGPVLIVEALLRGLRIRANGTDVTVTLTPTSVPDAQGSVTEQSQQNPRRENKCG